MMSSYVNNSKWMFLIDGDTQYFRQLSELSIIGCFDVGGGISELHDCTDDNFYLHSIYFEDETNPELVWRIGYELTKLYNGIQNIYKSNPIALELKELYFQGRQQLFYSDNKNINNLLDFPNFTSDINENETRLNEQFQTIKEINNHTFILIYLATIRADVYLILKFFSYGINYGNLYKILETIEELSTLNNINISIDKSQKKSFTNTANNYNLSEFDSRHGFKQVIKQNNTPSMNISDAHEFISSIARNYLSQLWETLKDKDRKEWYWNLSDNNVA